MTKKPKAKPRLYLPAASPTPPKTCIDELVPSDSAILPNRVLSIYFASLIKHAKVGKYLSAEWNEFEWTARWPHLTGKVQSEMPFAKVFWEMDAADIRKAEIVLVYAESGDNLRGTLVEAGIALGQGKSVIVIGDNQSYGSWQYHPLVHRADDLTAARQLLRVLAL
jgi:nucleoside 2-deoxyribosyltransferase